MRINHGDMTLEHLATRLTELERTNERLAADLAALRAERTPADRPSAVPAPAADLTEANERTSRRGLLRAVAGVAAATAGVGAVLQGRTATVAAAGPGSFDSNTSGTPAVLAQGSNGATGVAAYSDTSYALFASSTSYDAVYANSGGSGNGVYAVSQSGYGVNASSTLGTAVYGATYSTAANATAIHGVLNASAPGAFAAAVRGESAGVGSDGIGVWGSHNGTGWGVYGTSAGIGVYAKSTGSGDGLYATSASGDAIHAVGGGGTKSGLFAEGGSGYGVVAISTGTKPAIVAANTGNSGAGLQASGNVGVVGSGAYGGYFVGSLAALRLAPTTTAGPPTSGAHLQGDLVVDSTGVLFICTAAGTPGTWVKVGAQ